MRKLAGYLAAAGAAGTTAPNALTYLERAVRGRPTSSAPAQTVEKLSSTSGMTIPGDEQTRGIRVAGLGLLTGLPAVAFAESNAPMTAMGITDPRGWPVPAWIGDLIAHLAFGLVTAATPRAVTRRSSAIDSMTAGRDGTSDGSLT